MRVQRSNGAVVAAAIAIYAELAGAVAFGGGFGGPDNQCRKEPALLSCPSPSAETTNTCCSETRGGLLLTTQFWTIYTGLESEGQFLPSPSPFTNWGIHGLWPDYCNGSYTQYCDLSRQYDPHPSPNTTTGTPDGTPVPPYTGPNVGTFLQEAGEKDLLKYMNTYWISRDEPNHVLWAHEFSKHATCFSTFDTKCYDSSKKQNKKSKYADIIDYFKTVISYQKRVPTGKWLANAKILPKNSTSSATGASTGYTLSDIQSTLAKKHGAIPYIGCSRPRYNETEEGKGSLDNGNTVLSEVWYYEYVYGRPQDGKTVPVDATGSTSNCAKARGAVKYFERTKGSEARPKVPY